MKTLLFIAYFFPPLGGGGVQRSLKFARYLPDHGWQPLVLTARRSRYWLTDPTLLRELPDEVQIHRTFSPDGLWLSSLVARRGAAAVRRGGSTSRLRRLASCVLVPDVYRPWKPFALRAARRIMRERRVDAILTTSSPDSAHLVGRDLARESGVPWVCDFRDPWTRRIAFDAPTRWHARRHETLERRVLTDASRIIVTTRETGEEFTQRVGVSQAKISVIPNGFDPEDFADVPAYARGSRFSLRYVGQLTAGRTLAPIIGVLNAFFARRPEARALTEVRVIGPREAENDALVAASGLDDVVSLEGPCAHREAISHLVNADVVLLVESTSPRAGLIAQGKLYECLYSSRPVLAVVPRGAVTRLLSELGGGVAVGGGEAEAGASYLDARFLEWRDGRPTGGASRDALRAYDRRALTRELAAALDLLH